MPQLRPTPAEPGALPKCLLDPCGDRPLPPSEVPMPPAELLTEAALFTKAGQPDLDVLMKHLSGEGLLAQDLLLSIVSKAQRIFEAEPNLLKLNDPITVVGDIHGQYYDLLKLLEVGGTPGEIQYVFLGDYVDRGSFSVEVLALLYAIKIRYPKRVRMLRGNHECRQMTSFFNFREECEYKYDINCYNKIMESFDSLPLAATINGKFLAVHGGISPELATVKAINAINRFCEPPREGLLCDLLWADPSEEKEGEEKKHGKKAPMFRENEVRGCSFFFTFDGAVKFLQKNAMLSIIRAHEAQLEGYKMHKTIPSTGFPSVITIFSAPNYCDVYNNKGAVLKFDNSTLNILQFNCTPHPYHLPNFMGVFSWSMPFVIEKITEMLYYVLQVPEGEEQFQVPDMPAKVSTMARQSLSLEQNQAVAFAASLEASLGGQPASNEASPSLPGQASSGDCPKSRAQEVEESRDRMRKKVRTIARMARMFKTLRQENETIVRLKGVCPGHKLAPGMLLAGKERLHSELELFDHAIGVDAANELRPDGSKGRDVDDFHDDSGDEAAHDDAIGQTGIVPPAITTSEH